MTNVNFSSIEMRHHDKPKFISPNVEHNVSAYLVRARISQSNVGEGFPSGMFGDAMPSPKRFFRRGPFRPKFSQFLFGNDVHPCRLFYRPAFLKYFRKMRKSQAYFLNVGNRRQKTPKNDT